MTEGTAGRRAALRLLEAVARGATFEAARDRHVASLADFDRRLAHELAAGVLRTRRALDARLVPLVEGRWHRLPPRLKDVLRLGAYQLTALDRVPAYAAVSTAVALAREEEGHPGAGLVNAVLRRLLREEPTGAGAAVAADGTSDPARRLAIEHSHPRWLVSRWLQRYGEADTRALLRWNDAPPPLVLQAVQGSNDELLAELRAAGVAAQRAPHGAGVEVPRGRPSQLPGYPEGRWVVQDAAQALVLDFAGIPERWLVYDACAAPGGKSVRLAPGRRVIAADRSRERVVRLVQTLVRAGSPAFPIVADAERPPLRAADAVLLDVPCTATGTLRRHPDARLRITPKRLARLTALQARFLDTLAAAVRVGGLLIYVTCSLEPEENAEQVRGFLARHPEFRRAERRGQTPADGFTPDGDLALLPHRHGTDGAYAARLMRVA